MRGVELVVSGQASQPYVALVTSVALEGFGREVEIDVRILLLPVFVLVLHADFRVVVRVRLVAVGQVFGLDELVVARLVLWWAGHSARAGLDLLWLLGPFPSPRSLFLLLLLLDGGSSWWGRGRGRGSGRRGASCLSDRNGFSLGSGWGCGGGCGCGCNSDRGHRHGHLSDFGCGWAHGRAVDGYLDERLVQHRSRA